jgi:hypothetical protein
MSGVRLDPPIDAAPVDGAGRQSEAWGAHHQAVADEIATLTAKLNAVGNGVTDGSDAAAGMVGEYLSASVGSGALTSATPLDRATLTLTAGDWDVAGSAVITASLATMTFAQAWLSTAANTVSDPGRASIQAQTTVGVLGVANFVVGPRRFSVTASTDVHLGCQANFPAGTTVTASAFIRARRMR